MMYSWATPQIPYNDRLSNLILYVIMPLLVGV